MNYPTLHPITKLLLAASFILTAAFATAHFAFSQSSPPAPLIAVNLAGAEFGSVFPGAHGHDYIYPSGASLDYYQARGIRLIRLPFRWERMQRTLYGPLNADELARMDAFINGAHARGMTVLIEAHNLAKYSINGASYAIGSAQVPHAAFADFWQKMAAHYKDHPGIWGFALTDEPTTGSLWPPAAQAGIDGVRAADPARLILIGGDGWSNAYYWPQKNDGLKTLRDPAGNLMFEASLFFDRDMSGQYVQGYDAEGGYPTIGVDRARPFIEWCQANGVRCAFGGYGVPDNDTRWLTVLDNFLAYITANGVGGAYWAGGPWWGSYSLSVEPRNGADRPQMPILQKYLPSSSVTPTGTATVAPSVPSPTRTPTVAARTATPNPTRTATVAPLTPTPTRTPRPRWVKGKVDLQGRVNDSGAQVMAAGETTTTGSDGSFNLLVAPGAHTLKISLDQYLAIQTVFDVEDDSHALDLPAVRLLGGDTDNSGIVDIVDLVLVAGAYDQTVPPANPRADLNRDGRVDLVDLTLVGGNYGKASPQPWLASVAKSDTDGETLVKTPIDFDKPLVIVDAPDSARAGEEVVVTVRLARPGLVGGADIILSFDPGALVPLATAQPGGAFAPDSSFIALNKVDQGKGQVRFAAARLGASADTLAQPTLFNVRFRAVQGGALRLGVAEVRLQ